MEILSIKQTPFFTSLFQYTVGNDLKKKRACKVISNNKMKLLRKTEDAVTTTKINKVAAKGSVTQLKCGTFFEAIPAFLILVM